MSQQSSRGMFKQAKQDTTELQEKSKGLKADIVIAEEAVKAAETARDNTIKLIGNIVHDSVFVSNDEVSDDHSMMVALSFSFQSLFMMLLMQVIEARHFINCHMMVQVENVVVKTYGELRTEDGLRNHVDLVQLLGIVDLEAGTAVAGVHACTKMQSSTAL